MRNLFLAAVLVLVAGGAQATLIDRGDGFIYDDVQDITWTQHANINGYRDWPTQMAWADGYSQAHSVYGTFDDWRLPTTLIPDSTCDGTFGADTGYGCTGSEMGHLFNVDGISSSSMGLFTNVSSGIYWSGTEYTPSANYVWGVAFGSGVQDAFDNLPYPNAAALGWAVRDGDVVPEPSTGLLVGLGLVGLAAKGRRRNLS